MPIWIHDGNGWISLSIGIDALDTAETIDMTSDTTNDLEVVTPIRVKEYFDNRVTIDTEDPNDNIKEIFITNSGSGYTQSTTTVSITGGGGSGATASITITGGEVTDITITDGGSGYTSVPTVTITDSGSGSGALAVAYIYENGDFWVRIYT